MVTTDGQTLRKADPMMPQAEEPPSDVSVIATPLTTTWGRPISAAGPEARHSASVDDSFE